MADESDTRSDTEEYKTQVLIIHCVIAAVLVLLTACIIYLFYRERKLRKLVEALDPMSKYKKVGPSLYIKRGQRDTSSISSSFKHFNTSPDNDESTVRDQPLRKNEVGTLDRNFFTTTNFNFDDPSNSANNTNRKNETGNLNRRQKTNSETEAMEAISNLDKVLY